MLRAVLEWGKDLNPDAEADVEESAEVLVLLWPPGEFKRLPRGTTAGQLIEDQVSIGDHALTSTACTAGLYFRASFKSLPLLKFDMAMVQPAVLCCAGHAVHIKWATDQRLGEREQYTGALRLSAL